ncbi:MAG: hypothetical protein IJ013_05595 [Bacteroidaceae bacterium]|nr:hypothetical protein [Bacteroidaceae bacterium]
MKMKKMKTRIVTLLAAFTLLFCAVGYAQTNGDVNEDGVVNEQDIESIIGIMQEAGGIDGLYYYYTGQTAITADNYESLAETSDTLLASKEYKTERFGYMYILVPDAVTSMKIQQPGLGFWSEDSYQIENSISIPGHTVYKTTGNCGANAPLLLEFEYNTPIASSLKGDVNGDEVVDVADIASVIKIMTDNGSVGPAEYYYYYTENGGTLANPTDPKITPDNYTTLAPPVYELMNSLTPEKMEKGWAYLLVPNSVKSIKVRDLNLNAYSTMSFEVVDESIPGHYVYKSQNPFSSGFGVFEFGYDETEE